MGTAAAALPLDEEHVQKMWWRAVDQIDALSERGRVIVQDVYEAVLARTRQVLAVIDNSAE